MAERRKSTDGRSETAEILGDAPDNMAPAPGGQGRSGGELARKIGTRDDKKRLDETSSGATRPLGHDQDGSGSKEKV